jgi:D-alanyl-D-alanine carboxypeptidase
MRANRKSATRSRRNVRIVQRLFRLVALTCCLAGLVGQAAAMPLLLVDAETTEVLYAEDAGQPWHPASLTKLMTAYVAFAAIAAGRVNLQTTVTISQHAWNQAPSKSGLEVGESVTMKDALYIMLVKSANDMAVAVAETVSGSEPKFVAEMNRMAGAMGLSATHYENANGLNDDKQVTSARDLAVLALYIRRDYPQYLPIFGTEAVRLNNHRLETNNDLLAHFSGTTGMKTGYICASGLNIVATVERNGRSLLAVVLGGSSARERNEMAAQLILRGLSGAVSGTGQSIVAVQNALDKPPVDMRPQICGKQAKKYVAAREKAFPMGLKGEPSYLTDDIEGAVYEATDLGLTGVPLPRPRPDYAPQAEVAAR